MSRKTDNYGLLYKDDPILGKTLTLCGALLPWIMCVFVIAPLLIVVGGLPWYIVTTTMPWVGLFASIIWIELN
jgi:hypothetical protein